MSRQGAGTSVPAPLACPAACWAGLLCVPVGGGPPARRPRRELRSARRLEARPGPATAHGHRSQAPRFAARPCPPVPPAPSTPVGLGRSEWLGQAPLPPTGTAAWPSGPSGALHTSEAWSLMVGLARRLEAPLQLLIINFARNSFTAHSNIECASLELQRFWGVSKNDRDKLRAKCGWWWCRRRPRAPQSGPVG